VKQGVRVEFVCGGRAIGCARRDFDTLVSAAGLFSGHIYDLPEQARRALEEVKGAAKRHQKILEEVASYMAAALLSEVREANGLSLVQRVFADRDLGFIKLLAQKLTQQPGVVALLGTKMNQPTALFARSAGLPFDMGALIKEAMAPFGGRGGGSRELAQGGVPTGVDLESFLLAAASKLK
jgi:alanyl-tRNA synthetase